MLKYSQSYKNFSCAIQYYVIYIFLCPPILATTRNLVTINRAALRAVYEAYKIKRRFDKSGDSVFLLVTTML